MTSPPKTKAQASNKASGKPSTKTVVPKIRRRKKKGHYHTGVHKSPKCKESICYRSGWERTICYYLDNLNTVDEYWYESVKIPYIANARSSKVRYYLPDFVVKFTDGSMKMVEVKRENQLSNLKVRKKADAARDWCSKQKTKITYEFWTDKMILPLQKLEKLAKKEKEEDTLDEIKKKLKAKNAKLNKSKSK